MGHEIVGELFHDHEIVWNVTYESLLDNLGMSDIICDMQLTVRITRIWMCVIWNPIRDTLNCYPLPPPFLHQEAQPVQALHVPGQEPLTAAMLASAQPQEQKQMLGERLFSIISETNKDLAGKITGMLLEIDNSELLHMLESRESLEKKVGLSMCSVFDTVEPQYKYSGTSL